MVGFTQPPEDQAVVYQFVYQPWQSEGALMTGSYSVLVCEECTVRAKYFFFEGDLTAILEDLEGGTVCLKYTSDLLI